MSDESTLWPLLNLHTSAPEDAHLYHEITEQHVIDVENTWKPILERHLSDLKKKHHYGTDKFDLQMFYEEADNLMIRDAHWDWGKKYDYYSSTIGYSSCSIVCDGMVQGLGYFDLSGKNTSRIIEDKPTGILYVDYIASAPWNRKQIENQKYAGIGEALITHAIKLSIDEDMDGRFGLHSLPQADNFYLNRCCMNDFGYDAEKKMRYFEMSAEQAAEWLSKFTK